jgi:hypothetical protein
MRTAPDLLYGSGENRTYVRPSFRKRLKIEAFCGKSV